MSAPEQDVGRRTPDAGEVQDPRPAAAPDHSGRATYSYLVGVYVGVNAVPDAYALVEGPDCAHMKTQFVQGNHDWMSTLTSVAGYHRIANTALHPAHMTGSREAPLRATLKRLAEHPATGGVMLTSMPMAFITGADYERVCRDVAAETGKTVVHVPGKSLSGDWLDGYAETLLALARQLPLDVPAPGDPRKVAIVGYLFDRNEGDHRANVRELRRLLGALDLDPVSIWLEGQRFADLARVREAGTVLSFPYGRRAARRVAQRTGATLVECELPFGPEASERWLRQVAEATGRQDRVDALLDAELSRVIPPLEFVIPWVFQNRRVGYVGDPILVRGLAEIVRLLGMRLDSVVVTDPKHHCKDLQETLGGIPVVAWPRMNELGKFLLERNRRNPLNLLVTNNLGIGPLPVATVEFGFASMYQHHLFDWPFLGFQGFLAFADTLANALRMHEVGLAAGAMGSGAAADKARVH